MNFLRRTVQPYKRSSSDFVGVSWRNSACLHGDRSSGRKQVHSALALPAPPSNLLRPGCPSLPPASSPSACVGFPPSWCVRPAPLDRLGSPPAAAHCSSRGSTHTLLSPLWQGCLPVPSITPALVVSRNCCAKRMFCVWCRASMPKGWV